MELLGKRFLDNSIQDWLIGVGIAVVCFAILKIVFSIVVHRFSSFAERTATDFDDLIVAVIKKTKFFFLAVVSLYFGIKNLTFADPILTTIDHITLLVLLVQAGIWVNGAVAFWLKRMMEKKKEEDDAASATTIGVMGFISQLVIWTIVLLLALDNFGVDITALVTGLGIGGIAVALALQNILGDLFASLSIVLDKPFVIGDFIIVNEYLGTVEFIGLKTTRVRSLSGEQVIFSNSDLLNSRVRNFKRMFERRIVFGVGVTYQTPAEKLARISEILKEIVESQELARFDRAHFKEFGDFSLNYEVVYFVKSPEFNVYMDIQQAINIEIYKRFADLGVEFAYPTQTLFVEGANGTEAASSAQHRQYDHHAKDN